MNNVIKQAKEFLKINGNKKVINLHGRTLIQSMYIIDKKLISLTQEKYNENLKEITLKIITGVGHHSKNHQAVLHPQLTKWLNCILF